MIPSKQAGVGPRSLSKFRAQAFAVIFIIFLSFLSFYLSSCCRQRKVKEIKPQGCFTQFLLLDSSSYCLSMLLFHNRTYLGWREVMLTNIPEFSSVANLVEPWVTLKVALLLSEMLDGDDLVEKQQVQEIIWAMHLSNVSSLRKCTFTKQSLGGRGGGVLSLLWIWSEA